MRVAINGDRPHRRHLLHSLRSKSFAEPVGEFECSSPEGPSRIFPGGPAQEPEKNVVVEWGERFQRVQN